MTIAVHLDGTRTAGAPPEGAFVVHGTTGDTTTGIFQFFIDLAAMVKGDALQIQILEKALAGGTQRVIYSAYVANVQDEPLWVSPSLILLQGWQFQTKQTAGAARAFPWSIRKVA